MLLRPTIHKLSEMYSPITSFPVISSIMNKSLKENIMHTHLKQEVVNPLLKKAIA